MIYKHTTSFSKSMTRVFLVPTINVNHAKVQSSKLLGKEEGKRLYCIRGYVRLRNTWIMICPLVYSQLPDESSSRILFYSFHRFSIMLVGKFSFYLVFPFCYLVHICKEFKYKFRWNIILIKLQPTEYIYTWPQQKKIHIS